MNRAIPASIFIIAFILITACGAFSQARPDIKLSGVYKGYVDTFGACERDTALATVFINYDSSPMTIVYDGCVLEHYSYAGEDVYYTGEGKQIKLGYFDMRNGKLGFYYLRILNHFFYGDTAGYVPFFWTKTAELDVNSPGYKNCITDFAAFKDFWKGFEAAFLKKDIDKLAEYTSFPFMDNTQSPPVKIEKQDFATFIDIVYSNISQIRGSMTDYKSEMWFPQRFGDSDPCFARSYMWSYSSPRLNFTKVNGSYKLTGAYEYE